MAFRFVTKNPTLSPLFAAVGLGVFGSLWYGAHVLRNNQDVIIARKANPEPWNTVQQHENTKLFSPNTSFWAGRVGLPDPRAAFLEDKSGSASKSAETSVTARAKEKVQESKAKRAENN